MDGQSETERVFKQDLKARIDHSDENPHFSNMPRQLLRTPITCKENRSFAARESARRYAAFGHATDLQYACLHTDAAPMRLCVPFPVSVCGDAPTCWCSFAHW